MGRRAEGAASLDGHAVYVPLALPGETIVADVEGERARIVAIERASPDRIPPFCKHFGNCGGCQLQHWQEAPYCQWKRGLVVQALRNRGIAADAGDLIDAHGGGRRRVSLHVRRRDGIVTAGFMAARSHDLLDIDHCPILVPALARASAIARGLGEKLGDCDVALTATDGGIDAAVKAERKIVEQEMAKLAGLANTLDVARLAVNGEVIVTRQTPRVAMGRASVVLPVNSFLQATAEGEQHLADLVMKSVGKTKLLADLFCGCGPFTLRLAEIARVAAFDNDKPAIAALAQAARSTPGLKPVEATPRDLFREPLVANELKEFDTVVFDPPRAGAEAQARQLAKSNVKTVVSVSCDAASFARDAEILIAGGYALKSITPVDQFKWTSHVETVALLQRSPLR